ncbi:MAG: DUF4412 domain-containing protein [Verrucomicrobiota bacterium]|nr:DUF4412 domain-containing protein [Verrucomicrobiota bacterium]
MMRLFLVSFWLLTFAARGDMVIVQHVDGMGQHSDMSIKIKGSLVRTDVSPEVSTITDGDSGEVTTLMHQQKMYMKIPASQTQELMKNMQKETAPGSSPAGAPKLQPTGVKEKVNGYDTEKFSTEIAGMKMYYWIAKDFPNYVNVLAQFSRLQQGGLGAMAKGMSPDPSTFGGMPVKTEVAMGAQKITSTLVSVKEESVDEKEFLLPADYKAMSVPSFGKPAASPEPSAK